MAYTRLAFIAAAACAVAGCSTSSHILVGTPRPPVAPDTVQVYLQPPPKYEQIATLSSTSQGSFALTGQQNMDKAMQRMKAEAAKLGANGILLQGVADTQSSSIGAGGGGTSYGSRSATGVGVGGSFALTSKVAQGLAIYVPPAEQPPH
jgi:hypothetical protein